MNPKGFNEYQKRMEKLGIKVDTVFNKKGIVQGHKLTDKLSGQIFKASEINRHLGLSSLMKPYTPLEPIIKIFIYSDCIQVNILQLQQDYLQQLSMVLHLFLLHS